MIKNSSKWHEHNLSFAAIFCNKFYYKCHCGIMPLHDCLNRLLASIFSLFIHFPINLIDIRLNIDTMNIAKRNLMFTNYLHKLIIGAMP